MPQKRNPERSEHLWTLARVVRAGAGLALEGLVGEHERDGAAWKTEWAVLPQATAAAAAALAFARELVQGLRVDEARMRANLDAQRGYVLAVSKDGSVEMMASDPIQNICALGPGLKRSNHDPPRYHASTLGRRGLFDAACIDAIHTDAMLPDAVLMTAFRVH